MNSPTMSGASAPLVSGSDVVLNPKGGGKDAKAPAARGRLAGPRSSPPSPRSPPAPARRRRSAGARDGPGRDGAVPPARVRARRRLHPGRPVRREPDRQDGLPLPPPFADRRSRPSPRARCWCTPRRRTADASSWRSSTRRAGGALSDTLDAVRTTVRQASQPARPGARGGIAMHGSGSTTRTGCSRASTRRCPARRRVGGGRRSPAPSPAATQSVTLSRTVPTGLVADDDLEHAPGRASTIHFELTRSVVACDHSRTPTLTRSFNLSYTPSIHFGSPPPPCFPPSAPPSPPHGTILLILFLVLYIHIPSSLLFYLSFSLVGIRGGPLS